MKFGGTSVGDVAAFERVLHVVSTQAERRPIVVVSAMTRVTDALLAAFEIAKKGEFAGAISSLEPQYERHIEVARHFIPEGSPNLFDAELQFARDELSDLLMRAARRSLPLSMLKDAIVSYGEQLSSRLVAEVLKVKGVNTRHVDSRRLIVTDDEFGAAQPIMEETADLVRLELEPAIDEGEVPVMGGFIAGNRAGETTTLGRGGSDYSAAIVAASLNARELQIWTDVTGVMTCDPRICSNARTIPVLSYEEAAELAYFGAKVLHPKTIKPAVDHGIPVRVCNTFEPGAVGTMVVAKSGEAPNKIKSIASKKGITILRVTSARMLGSYGFMSAVFQVFDRYRTVIDVISTSEVSIALTLDNTASLEKIVDELSRLGDVEVVPGYAVICVVGEGLRASTGLASKIFSTIDDVHIELVSHGASAVNLTFVVKEEDAAGVISKLHSEFFI
ncbi:MAG TPA: lysine-sensitive aspartokinase 3 [Pyrinomonadaceae bacterium]|nr:lysine-sensitive aspartokinase 3 [Chloracidobacterium sp.]HBE81543.1 lysine-sensitive aspartokinase 3 [Blastocatellia bacterium]HRK49285.1 lysine-sensitive aspartokinase 3 [Pyrinomonadaceae bacterium]